MDQLDREIAERHQRLSELRDQIRIAEVELRALEHAASLRPIDPPLFEGAIVSPPKPSGTGRQWQPAKGRQPGAISKEWRNVLLGIADQFSGKATATEIASLARKAGIKNANDASIRQRMVSYAQHGYIQPLGDDTYFVTDLAMKRFNISTALTVLQTYRANGQAGEIGQTEGPNE